jgi:hypothetical protein
VQQIKQQGTPQETPIQGFQITWIKLGEEVHAHIYTNVVVKNSAQRGS